MSGCEGCAWYYPSRERCLLTGRAAQGRCPRYEPVDEDDPDIGEDLGEIFWRNRDIFW